MVGQNQARRDPAAADRTAVVNGTYAIVEDLPEAGQYQVRCGAPDCRSRRRGAPVLKAHIIAHLQTTGPVHVGIRCPRCEATPPR